MSQVLILHASFLDQPALLNCHASSVAFATFVGSVTLCSKSLPCFASIPSLPPPEFWLPGVRALIPRYPARTHALFEPPGIFAWFATATRLENIGRVDWMLPYVIMAVVEPVSADFVCK